MSKRPPGLQYNQKTKKWIIDKVINGERIKKCLSAGTQQQAEIEFYRVLSQYGVTQHDHQLTFREAWLKYIRETSKRSLDRDIVTLEAADPFIGNLTLDNIHMGTIQPFIDFRRDAGIKSGTVKRDLAIIRAILKLAVVAWRNQNGKPYLTNVPLFKIPDWEDSALPYPLTMDEQVRLFKELPDHLKPMALFAVNTGLCEQGVCWLRWDWEVNVPEIGGSVFITPGRRRDYDDGTWPGEKNKEDQLVVLNRIARSVIEKQRGKHPDYVFPFRGARLTRMHNSGWKSAWRRAGLPESKEYNRGPHNLKHTFGRRLRNAGVPADTRKFLLHHTDGDITLSSVA